MSKQNMNKYMETDEKEMYQIKKVANTKWTIIIIKVLNLSTNTWLSGSILSSNWYNQYLVIYFSYSICR